jgi:hypothetical protein
MVELTEPTGQGDEGEGEGEVTLVSRLVVDV